jgi:hypothetical protein
MPYIFARGTHKSDFPKYTKINFWTGHLIEVYVYDVVRGTLRIFPCYCTQALTHDHVCTQHAPWYDRLLGRTR